MYTNLIISNYKICIHFFFKSNCSILENNKCNVVLVVYGSWFDHVLPYWEFCKENPEKVFFMSYEELKLVSYLSFFLSFFFKFKE